MNKHISTFSFILSLGLAIGFFIGTYWIWTIDQSAFRPVVAVLSGLSLFVPRLLFTHTMLKKHLHMRALLYLENAWMVLILLNTFGSLSFYYTTQYYDMILHFVDPIIGGFMIALLVAAWEEHDGEYTESYVAYMTLAITFVIIFVWEAYEFYGDMWFGTQMFGQEGEPFDTFYDIVAGVAALFFLRILIHRYLHYFRIKKMAR